MTMLTIKPTGTRVRRPSWVVGALAVLPMFAAACATTDTVAEPTTEPVAEPTTEPVAQPTTEPVTEPSADTAAFCDAMIPAGQAVKLKNVYTHLSFNFYGSDPWIYQNFVI